MSIGLHGNCRTTASYNLSDTVQPTCSITLGGNIEHVHKEHNQSNECNKSGQSSESDKCTCDPGTNATCTCTGATPVDRSTVGHTSFPCAHCNDYDPRDISSASDYIERDYADYISATGASRKDTCSGVRDSDESRDFKQANADSRDSIERRTGIPAGVTI